MSNQFHNQSHYQTHYQILDLDLDASISDIKKAYHKLAKLYHPDKSNDPQSQSKYQAIHKAYQVLSDPILKSEYDKTGISTDKGDILIDPLEAILHIRNEESDIPNVVVHIEIDIIDQYNGCIKETTYSRISKCQRCDGTGTKSKKNEDCLMCEGRGAILDTVEGGEMGYMCREKECSACRGKGIDPNTLICKKCDGNRYQTESIECDVEIPKGAYNGYCVILENEGNYIPESLELNKSRTDVLFYVITKSNIYKNIEYKRDVFIKELKRADKADLLIDVDINFEESICGTQYEFKHLSKSIVSINIDRVILHNDILIVYDRGMPNIKSKGFGNLYIRFNVQRPDLDSKTKKKIWQLLSDEPHRKIDSKNECDLAFLDDVI